MRIAHNRNATQGPKSVTRVRHRLAAVFLENQYNLGTIARVQCERVHIQYDDGDRECTRPVGPGDPV